MVLVTDGRHNAAARPEPIARQLGLRNIPIEAIEVGSEVPPPDAAVVSLSTPEAVYTGDRLAARVELKLDGLAGRKVEVVLRDGQKEVSRQSVLVPTASYRTSVVLGDEPKAAGLHRYAVAVLPAPGETILSNNTQEFSLCVTDERTRLLVIEGRPRWEFRYIKNLFADRDKSVLLQYVLLQPDHVAGAPAPAVRHASATSTAGPEATALPADEKEWMKFDVILLGDVPPEKLPPGTLDILQRFVTRRGGTLVVVSGPDAMPQRYTGTVLEQLLPMTWTSQPPTRDFTHGFRLAETPEGRVSPLLDLGAGEKTREEVLASLPEMFWRQVNTAAKPGATVLAYAVTPDDPSYVQPPSPDAGAASAPAPAPPSAGDADLLARRQAFERSHALICTQAAPPGRVMMLAFDRTWRFRYRAGDTYHHRFWGQVLRWATAGQAALGRRAPPPRHRPHAVRPRRDHPRHRPAPPPGPHPLDRWQPSRPACSRRGRRAAPRRPTTI